MTSRGLQATARKGSQHLGASVLVVFGVVFVFSGFASALGFSWTGIVASVSAVVALLYVGGLWFGQRPASAARGSDTSVILFSADLHTINGPAPGVPLVDLFPEAMRGEIETHCRLALAGQSSRFACGEARETFDAAPVRTDKGVVAYGLLLSGALSPSSNL